MRVIDYEAIPVLIRDFERILPGSRLFRVFLEHEALTRIELNQKIGEPGFEPGTSATRTQRATKLRYSPLTLLSIPDAFAARQLQRTWGHLPEVVNKRPERFI